MRKVLSDRAYYICHLDRIGHNVKLWREKFPNIHPYYATKCNNNPVILTQLAQLGVSFDCASQREIQTVQTVLTDVAKSGRKFDVANPIIYANPFKMISHLHHAYEHGVDLMTFDCIDELKKIDDVASQLSLWRPQCILRIAVDDSQSVCRFNSKFGFDATQGNLERLKNAYLKTKNIDLVGVSFHAGSGCKSAESYADAIARSRNVFDYMEQAVLHMGTNKKMSILDLGGGFIQEQPLLDDVAKTIGTSLQAHFGAGDVQFIAEPGRFMAANLYDLHVKIVGKKVEWNASEHGATKKTIKYYVNESVYGGFNCKIFDHAKFKFDYAHSDPMGSLSSAVYQSTIFGPTCDSMDVIIEQVELPELEIGDRFCFYDMGAYTASAGSEFNGIPRPIIIYSWGTGCKNGRASGHFCNLFPHDPPFGELW